MTLEQRLRKQEYNRRWRLAHQNYYKKYQSKNYFPKKQEEDVKITDKQYDRIVQFCNKNKIQLINLSFKQIIFIAKQLNSDIVLQYYMYCLKHRLQYNITDLKDQINKINETSEVTN